MSTKGYNGFLPVQKKKDIIISSKMERLGHNLAYMIQIVYACYKKGMAICFLENRLSTEGTMGKMVIKILTFVAEAELGCILERTNDGGIVAMASGVKFGRKPHSKTALSDNLSIRKIILTMI